VSFTDLPAPTAKFRDARYSPRRLEIEYRPGGEMVLTNPATYDTRFMTMTAALTHWASKTPSRVWLAERSGGGWRTITYAEAHEQITAIAGYLLAMGVVRAEPLLIMAHNGIDHALIAYAAMSQRMPIAPVSPQYGLRGSNPARLARALEVLKPACVYTDDAALFAEGLSAPGLSGLPVIASRNPGPRHILFSQVLKGQPDAGGGRLRAPPATRKP
jgi:feruloyl-CoA synthase